MRRRLYIPRKGTRLAELTKEWGGEGNLRRYIVRQLVKGETWDTIGKSVQASATQVQGWCERWRLDIEPAGRVVYDPVSQMEYWPSPEGVIECIPQSREQPR